MNHKRVYLFLCVIGVAIPYASFAPWAIAHGLNLRLFLQEISANRIGVFFALDVLVSAAVVLCFAGVERRRVRTPFIWAVVPALLLVGVSLALPLLLYLREVGIEASRTQALRSSTAS